MPKHIREDGRFIQNLRYCNNFEKLLNLFNNTHGPTYMLLPSQLETLNDEFRFKNWNKLKVLFERLWDGNMVTDFIRGLAAQLRMSEEEAQKALEDQIKEME